MFRAVPRGELLPRLGAELDWADAMPRRATACSAPAGRGRPLDEGRICSKRAAAEWALERGAPRPLVATVLGHHLAATATGDFDETVVAAFVAAVRARLAAGSE